MDWLAAGVLCTFLFTASLVIGDWIVGPAIICQIREFFKIGTEQQILKDINIQKEIILRLKNPYTDVACSVQAQLEARTLPNARLQAVFGVNNAFTTQDIKTANTFKHTARKKLRSAVKINKQVRENGTLLMEDMDARWEDMVASIRIFVQEEVVGANEIINLAELVQFITLKISLMYLFNPGEVALNDREAIKYVAKTINILWIQSKNTNMTGINESSWADEQRLHHHLHNITGLNPKNPTTNPMNFILPAYETMWRAVLRGLLEIYFRPATTSLHWQQILHKFMDNPQRDVFRNNDSTTEASALDIVKEILRLYPPTRRVNRRFPDDPLDLTRSADIEKCHRNALLVPTGDPDVFRPGRWLEIKKNFKLARPAKLEELRMRRPNAEYKLSDYEEELGYMPFALSCPAGGKATQGFGFKMVGLLIAALCEGFDKLNGTEIDSVDTVMDQDETNEADHHMPGEYWTPEGSVEHDSNFDMGSRTIYEAVLELGNRPNVINDLKYQDDREPRLQKWKLQAESPNDELPPLGTALKSERSDYLSLVYRRVV